MAKFPQKLRALPADPVADQRASRLHLQLIHLPQQGEGGGPVTVPRAGAENAVEVDAVHLQPVESRLAMSNPHVTCEIM